LQNDRLLGLILATFTFGTSGAAFAETSTDTTQSVAVDTGAARSEDPASSPDASTPPPSQPSGLAADIKAYYTAPLHWDGAEWAWFGGALLAIGVSHHYDTQVRTHFTKNLAPGQTVNSNDAQDILPTVAVLVGTWGYAGLVNDSNGHREAWAMFEAAGLSTVTAYALKYTIRREGPDQTTDPNEWFKSGGNSFPSTHATAAFAVGTVLAESGNDDYRWLRRVLGYGLGIGTSYLRLKHNAHWLSDTEAGAALGISTAHFTMNHTYRNSEESRFALVPVEGGAMITYRVSLD
jgi:membrane-associated phospholipid phosphatase